MPERQGGPRRTYRYLRGVDFPDGKRVEVGETAPVPQEYLEEFLAAGIVADPDAPPASAEAPPPPEPIIEAPVEPVQNRGPFPKDWGGFGQEYGQLASGEPSPEAAAAAATAGAVEGENRGPFPEPEAPTPEGEPLEGPIEPPPELAEPNEAEEGD